MWTGGGRWKERKKEKKQNVFLEGSHSLVFLQLCLSHAASFQANVVPPTSPLEIPNLMGRFQPSPHKPNLFSLFPTKTPFQLHFPLFPFLQILPPKPCIPLYTNLPSSNPMPTFSFWENQQVPISHNDWFCSQLGTQGSHFDPNYVTPFISIGLIFMYSEKRVSFDSNLCCVVLILFLQS